MLKDVLFNKRDIEKKLEEIEECRIWKKRILFLS